MWFALPGNQICLIRIWLLYPFFPLPFRPITYFVHMFSPYRVWLLFTFDSSHHSILPDLCQILLPHPPKYLPLLLPDDCCVCLYYWNTPSPPPVYNNSVRGGTPANIVLTKEPDCWVLSKARHACFWFHLQPLPLIVVHMNPRVFATIIVDCCIVFSLPPHRWLLFDAVHHQYHL